MTKLERPESFLLYSQLGGQKIDLEGWQIGGHQGEGEMR